MTLGSVCVVAFSPCESVCNDTPVEYEVATHVQASTVVTKTPEVPPAEYRCIAIAVELAKPVQELTVPEPRTKGHDVQRCDCGFQELDFERAAVVCE
jgi:hypothetical protein